MKLEKSPFDNHRNYFRQEVPMDAKTGTCLIIKKIYLHAIVLNVNAEEEKSKLIFEEDVILNERETKYNAIQIQ